MGEFRYDGKEGKLFHLRQFHFTLFGPNGERILKIDRGYNRVHGDALVYMYGDSPSGPKEYLLGEIRIIWQVVNHRYKIFDCTAPRKDYKFDPFGTVTSHWISMPMTDKNSKTFCSIQSLGRK